MAQNPSEGIVSKSMQKALRKCRLPKSSVIGSVIELRSVDGRDLHILTSVQSVRWQPGKPLSLFVADAGADTDGCVLREIIPYKPGFMKGLQARMVMDDGTLSADYEMIVR